MNIKKQKIVKMTPIKTQPVYDMEVPGNHNFVLDNGIIAHNCYAALGYTSAYLKNVFQLEWWTSEMNVRAETSKAEDFIRHYMSVVGSLFKEPNIANPTSRFVIEGDKIQAPLYVIKGIGEKSIKVIGKHGPYASLQELCDKVPGKNLSVSMFHKIVCAGAAKEWQDQSLPINEQQAKIFEEFKAIRNIKPKKVYDFNIPPLDIFKQERELNYCFKQPLISYPHISGMLKKAMPQIYATGKEDIPYVRGQAPVLSGVKFASELVNREYEKEVGMVVLVQSSRVFSGDSKKTGRPYSFLKIYADDGLRELEIMWWDKKFELNWPEGTLAYIRGTISEGYKKDISFNVSEVERLS